MAAKIKKGDLVQILSGRSKGVQGNVLSIIPAQDTAIVSGVNIVTRHTKASQNTQGGLIKKEAPIHLSNVALLDPKDSKPVRVGFKVDKDGNKLRYSKRSGEFIDKVKVSKG